MTTFRGKHGGQYEQDASSKQTSEEVLYAIDQLENCDSEQVWEDGGHEDEIIASLPTDYDIEEGEVLYWGGEFARFEAGKWVRV